MFLLMCCCRFHLYTVVLGWMFAFATLIFFQENRPSLKSRAAGLDRVGQKWRHTTFTFIPKMAVMLWKSQEVSSGSRTNPPSCLSGTNNPGHHVPTHSRPLSYADWPSEGRLLPFKFPPSRQTQISNTWSSTIIALKLKILLWTLKTDSWGRHSFQTETRRKQLHGAANCEQLGQLQAWVGVHARASRCTSRTGLAPVQYSSLRSSWAINYSDMQMGNVPPRRDDEEMWKQKQLFAEYHRVSANVFVLQGQ